MYVYLYISIRIIYVFIYVHHMYCVSAQEWTNCNLAVHERTSVHFLVLPGSLLSITEITEYRYFSPSKPISELKYTSE